MRLVLDAHCSHEVDEAFCWVVEVDAGCAGRLLELVMMVRELKGRRSDVWKVAALGGQAELYELEYGEDRDGELVPGPEAVRTECDQEVAYDDHVYFQAYLKHTDVRVESGPVPFALLTAIAREDVVEMQKEWQKLVAERS